MASSGEGSDHHFDLCPFFCPACKGIFVEPVTDICGHTYCRFCSEDQEFCMRCSSDVLHQPVYVQLDRSKTNITIAKLVEKMSIGDPLSIVKENAFKLYKKSKFHDAIETINDSLESVLPDIYLYLLRCKCLLSIDCPNEALEDVDVVFKFTNQNTQAHLLKAEAMKRLDRPEDTISAYLKCFTFNKMALQCTRARRGLEQAIHDVIQPPGSLEDPSSSSSLKGFFSSSSPLCGHHHHHHQPCNPCIPSDGYPSQIHCTENYNKTNNSNEQLCSGRRDNEENPNVEQQIPDAGQHCKESSQQFWQCPVMLCKQKRGFQRPLRFFNTNSQNQFQQPLPSASSGSLTDPNGNRPRPPICLGDREKFLFKLSQLIKAEDLECSLCLRILLDPVTTRCGHVFCLKCMYRCLDHKPCCPVCKETCSLLTVRQGGTTHALVWALDTFFKEKVDSRRQALLSVMATRECISRGENVPIFVCTMAFPSIQCSLHVFEPRYKFMVRCCLESETRQFGMCHVPPKCREMEFSGIGTMLEILTAHYLEDGRSVLYTVGRRRFKVIERSVRDGYNVARIQYISDSPIPEYQRTEIVDLMTKVYDKCHSWFQSISECRKRNIIHYYGTFPRFEEPQFVASPAPDAEAAAAATHAVIESAAAVRDCVKLLGLNCPTMAGMECCDLRHQKQQEQPISSSTSSSSSSFYLLFSEDGPNWVWYITAILPVEENVKVNLLLMTSVKCRLIYLNSIVTCVSEQGDWR